MPATWCGLPPWRGASAAAAYIRKTNEQPAAPGSKGQVRQAELVLQNGAQLLRAQHYALHAEHSSQAGSTVATQALLPAEPAPPHLQELRAPARPRVCAAELAVQLLALIQAKRGAQLCNARPHAAAVAAPPAAAPLQPGGQRPWHELVIERCLMVCGVKLPLADAAGWCAARVHASSCCKRMLSMLINVRAVTGRNCAHMCKQHT